MHRWVDGPIWTSLLVKCLNAFSLFMVCDLVHCKQLKHLQNLKVTSRLSCNTTQQCHNKLLQVIEGNCPWVPFQLLTNRRYSDYPTLAHNEIEFNQVTLHMSLSKGASLTDNTLAVTWILGLSPQLSLSNFMWKIRCFLYFYANLPVSLSSFSKCENIGEPMWKLAFEFWVSKDGSSNVPSWRLQNAV